MKNIEKYILLLFSLLISISLFSQNHPDDICGFWRTLKGNAQIEVYRENNGNYAAKVVWLKIEKDRPDINNEDQSLRSRKILGLQILKGLHFDKKQSRWEKGQIYDPETGRTYHCIISLEHDKSILLLKGYVTGLRMLNRESRWIRETKLRP